MSCACGGTSDVNFRGFGVRGLPVQNSHPALEIGEARIGSQGIKLGIDA